ncbi:ParA family protein [Zooshikella ganghwensis]|uniref:ParA family protein n=1 Tax=Zooshikella ganghwensis TaxID=202772 RepID=A0A4P9VT51_9GAMM|nr:ParA family protein [Zooshikella ganghwensis]RDH45594.1 ParA family protein [Zooshikella ganghwensis]
MKSISLFNNKGGVGKTTLTFHLGFALSELGYKVLMIDADPQCNLTIYSLDQETIHSIWEKEDQFIDEGYESAKHSINEIEYQKMMSESRSLHFLLKPTEEGTGEPSSLPPPIKLSESLDLIAGRLTLHLFEEKIAERWAGLYRGDPLALRTVTKIRELTEKYSSLYSYDYVIIDTSPSLGSLNKVIISTVDGFFVPASPDLFSLYGIKNIGRSLSSWKNEFDTIYQLISTGKRHLFPNNFVSFLGYTIYNAKKYTNKTEWHLAVAHYNYAKKIPATIKENIKEELRNHLSEKQVDTPIGGISIMHTHNTFPAMAQYYHLPMWKVPFHNCLEGDHLGTLRLDSEVFNA